jgi:DNA (cytosine-5)-methyltransferase 1
LTPPPTAAKTTARMRELSLFTGAGGGVYGSILLGHRVMGYVENDPHCQRVIAQRIADGIFDRAPIFGDIRAFSAEGYARSYRGMVDLVSGGFPCQPFSVVGKRAGKDDARNMWPATLDTVRAIRPRWCFFENVPGLVSSGYFGEILGGLAALGFDAEWTVLGADDCGAPHRRKRLWILAYSNRWRAHQKQKRKPGIGDQIHTCRDGKVREMANTKRLRELQPQGGERKERGRIGDRCSWWDEDPADVPHTMREGCRTQGTGQEEPGQREGSSRRPTQPPMGRMAYGVARRVQRLRAIGNGQVPIVAATAFRLLMERFQNSQTGENQ